MRTVLRALLFAAVLCLVSAPMRAADGQTISTTTCPGAGCVAYTVSGQGSVGIQLTGPFVGTVQFEQSNDGVTWFSLTLYTQAGASATSATNTGFWTGSIAGANFVRVRFSAYTSGGATVYETTARAAVGAVAAPVVNTGQVTFTNGTTLSDPSGSGKLLLSGTTPTVQFGGTTSSQPALRTNGTTSIEVILADASAYAGLTAASLSANGNGMALSNSAGAFFLGSGGAVKLFMGTAPSAPSACGTSPAVTSSNGSAVFVVTGGTGGTATGCTITMPAATTGWTCSINNITGSAAHRADKTTVQTASTTTSVTWEYQTVSTGAATAFTASDVFRGACWAY